VICFRYWGQIGKQMFPSIADSLAPAAAATTMFDPVRVKWLQTALNLLGTTPPLDVDGEYGPNHHGRRPAVSGNSSTGRRRMGWRRPHSALQLAFPGRSRRRGESANAARRLATAGRALRRVTQVTEVAGVEC
jgi:hypothetical protein